MSSASKTMSVQVRELAQRLRLLQAELADESDEVRRECLSGEILRATEEMGLLPEDRPAFLAGLAAEFPTWSEGPVAMAPAAPSEAAPAKLPTDPNALVGALLELWPHLPDESRAALTERLVLGGVAAVSRGGGGGVDSGDLKELTNAMQGGDITHADVHRMAQLLALLSATVLQFESVGWNAWAQIGQGSRYTRGTPLRRNLARFVSGNPDVSIEQVKGDVEKLRKLLAALVASMSQAASAYGDRVWHEFAPEAIRAVSKSAMIPQMAKANCWDTYCERSGRLRDEEVTRDFMGAVQRIVEELLMGSRS